MFTMRTSAKHPLIRAMNRTKYSFASQRVSSSPSYWVSKSSSRSMSRLTLLLLLAIMASLSFTSVSAGILYRGELSSFFITKSYFPYFRSLHSIRRRRTNHSSLWKFQSSLIPKRLMLYGELIKTHQ